MKGTTATLMRLLLGEYYYEPSVRLLTGKALSSSPTAPMAEVAALRGRRMVVMNEPAASSKISVERMKAWAGGDTISARLPHSQRVLEFLPQFTLHLCCNDLPGFSGMDGGVERRLKVIPFLGDFRGRAKDAGIKTKLSREVVYRQAFVLMLLEARRRGMPEEPGVVHEATQKYLKRGGQKTAA